MYAHTSISLNYKISDTRKLHSKLTCMCKCYIDTENSMDFARFIVFSNYNPNGNLFYFCNGGGNMTGELDFFVIPDLFKLCVLK